MKKIVFISFNPSPLRKQIGDRHQESKTHLKILPLSMLHLLGIAVILLVLSSCSGSGSGSQQKNGPPQLLWQEQLASRLPKPWLLDSFDIEASQNVGTEVEPIWRSRFKAICKLDADTFAQAEKRADVLFLHQTGKKGQTRDIYGISTTRRYADSWQIQFSLEGNSLSNVGQPRSAFNGTSVVEGTSEEAEIKRTLLAEVNGSNEDRITRAITILFRWIGEAEIHRALTGTLTRRLDQVDSKVMQNPNSIHAMVGFLYKTLEDLGECRNPETVPHIVNAYKYQGIGDRGRTEAERAIMKIGKASIPYLRHEVDRLQQWYFSEESRSYHQRVYGKPLTDQELRNIAWAPRYLQQLIERLGG
ncbi:MAG: hypothetical protein AB1631_10460 [Acidobacteriota bacterium]